MSRRMSSRGRWGGGGRRGFPLVRHRRHPPLDAHDWNVPKQRRKWSDEASVLVVVVVVAGAKRRGSERSISNDGITTGGDEREEREGFSLIFSPPPALLPLDTRSCSLVSRTLSNTPHTHLTPTNDERSGRSVKVNAHTTLRTHSLTHVV